MANSNIGVFISNFFRALRLLFITASVFPFLLGSALAKKSFSIPYFLLGLISVVCVHLGANLINDYADSKSGADWQDRRFYGFFGGSKLIQEQVFSERFYLFLAMFFLLIGSIPAIVLSFIMERKIIIGFYLLILLLAWSYSHGPVRFSYRGMGEILIFLLFGPALVMGGYFVQTEQFPAMKSFLLSLAPGFFTTAILFANEIPDFEEDKLSGKNNWIRLLGKERSFILYYCLIAMGFVSILLNVFMKLVSPAVFISFLFIFLAVKAGGILKNCYTDKIKMMESSRLTIALASIINVIMILGVLL